MGVALINVDVSGVVCAAVVRVRVQGGVCGGGSEPRLLLSEAVVPSKAWIWTQCANFRITARCLRQLLHSATCVDPLPRFPRHRVHVQPTESQYTSEI